MVHLGLPLEVGDHSQAFHHRLRVVLAGEVDDELVEDVDLHVVERCERLLEECDTVGEGEHRLLVMRVAYDADDDAVEDGRRPADHVDVSVRDRVVRAWVDSGDHRVNRVIRAEPYRRLVTRSSGSSGSVFAGVSTTSRPPGPSTSGTARRAAAAGRAMRRTAGRRAPGHSCAGPHSPRAAPGRRPCRGRGRRSASAWRRWR